MRPLTKLGVFLMILCLLGMGAAMLFWDLGGSCVSVLRTGTGRGGYVLTASDSEGGVYILGREKSGAYQLIIGDQAGRRTERWPLPDDVLPRESQPALLYPAAGGAVYLGLYNTRSEDTALQLYRITEQGKSVELLLSEQCAGDSLPEQMAGVRLSSFSTVDSVVTFAVIRGDSAVFYQRTSAGSGLEELRRVSQPDLRDVLALSGGTWALVTGDSLVRSDRDPVALENGEIVTRLYQAGPGVYYVDGASLSVFYADFADWRPYAYLRLEKDAYDLNNVTDLSLTRDGDALLLMDGERLLLDRGSTVSDLSGMLYRPAWQCALILAGLVLGVLLLSFILWYLICEQRRLRLPMLLRWGVVIVAAAALSVGGLLRWAIEPVSRAAAAREAASLLGSVFSLRMQGYDLSDPRLPELLGDDLAGALGGLYRDATAEVYHRGGNGVWTLISGNTGLPPGVRAELSPGFDRARAAEAQMSGSVFWMRLEGVETHFVLYRAQGGYVLCADVGGGRLLEAGRAGCGWMVWGLWFVAALLCVLTLILLCRITIGVRQISKGMERLAAGDRDVKISLGGGDELESLAEDVNALSRTVWELEERRSELARSYRRFVPERVLSLLGKKDIAQVDKHTFVSRHLAAMMLTFSFPEEVYAASGKDLFDNVNEIIERTAHIVTSKGGMVFNFAYNGYDAVFESGSTAAVSTAVAVQQEILEINREREVQGRPQVVVRIALDEGSVMLGLVGDENQLEPASISSSFSVARRLIELGERLEANILCTEVVMAGARGYASRYMGKCGQGGTLIRVYEIFDGDPYEVRKVKEQTSERFSDGVYALYGQDFSGAKSIFLSLVHRSAGDGGARYYLYLADQLENRPDEEISLDAGI